MRVGLPRMHKESGERRDLLPSFVAALCRDGATDVVLEDGYGAAMDLSPEDYTSIDPRVRFATYREVFDQDVVVVIRCPDEASDPVDAARRDARVDAAFPDPSLARPVARRTGDRRTEPRIRDRRRRSPAGGEPAGRRLERRRGRVQGAGRDPRGLLAPGPSTAAGDLPGVGRRRGVRDACGDPVRGPAPAGGDGGEGRPRCRGDGRGLRPHLARGLHARSTGTDRPPDRRHAPDRPVDAGGSQRVAGGRFRRMRSCSTSRATRTSRTRNRRW